MCEFKIINKTDGSQLGEDILVLTYTDDNELIFKDVLGMGEKIDSALIYDVNTLNQKCVVLQHPLIKDFLSLLNEIIEHRITKSSIEEFQDKLNEIKETL